MTLSEWLNRLEKLHPKAIDLGLGRVAIVARKLDLLNDNPVIFTVAGTNGKGSTTALLRQVLRAHNLTTGLYTSPHLVVFNERITINDTHCTDEQIVAALDAVDKARGDTSLTYFEFTTLAAIWLFKQANLDVWILEVGMGGRLDAVNLWNPDVAIVTSIDLDHQQWLGPDRESIGNEKVAIGRAHRPLIIGEPDLPTQCLQTAHQTGAKLFCIGTEFNWQQDSDTQAISVTLNGQQGQVIKVNHNYFHPNNIASVVQALVSSPLVIDLEILIPSIEQTQLLGRQTLITQSPDTLLDVGHNPHAARWLRKQIESKKYAKVHCIIGMLIDKNIRGTVQELLPVVDRWYPTTLSAERGCPGSKIAELLAGLGAHNHGDPGETPSRAYKQLLSSVHDSDLIIVFGSFYTVSDILTNN